MEYSTLQIREKAVKAYFKHGSISAIATMYDVHRSTVHRWITKARKEHSLERKSQPGSGRPPKLTVQQTRQLTRLILKPASYYGYDTDFWTIKRIIFIAKKFLKVTVSKTTMYDILHTENYSYKKPEKRYYEANKHEQKAWAKDTVPQLKTCLNKHKGILYFEDESSISLHAVLGKTWGPVGVKTLQTSTGNKTSLSAMSAISHNGQLLFTLHEKKITSCEVIHFLKQLLLFHCNRHIVVVMDRAASDTSRATQQFISSQKRLHVFYLPARSPEWNPDEKVWNHLKHVELKSHQARNKKELKTITRKHLRRMSKKPKLLRALFRRCEVSEFFL